MRKLIRVGFIVTAALFFGASLLTVSTAQKRTGTFSHNTRAHKEDKFKDCNSCHTLPTKNWVAARKDGQQSFPDVRNYPYNKHTSCNGCHARDVFSNGGVFCGSCHTVPSMLARAVRPFPNVSHPTQFRTIFPHDVHQDIIASNRPKTNYTFAAAHFVPAAFVVPDDKPKPTIYSCAICHKTTTKIPKYEMRMPFGVKPMAPPVPDKFDKPVSAEFFKTSPEGHATCFTCHYQFQNLPVGKRDCSGCHALTKPYVDKNTTLRYSLKFNHERDGHDADCTTCHIRITQSDDIRKKNAEGIPIIADVPITSCRKCHQTQEADASRKIMTTEIETREKDKTFVCTYCHTSAIGKYETPVSHNLPK